MLQFEPIVSLGTIGQTIVFMIGGLTAWYKHQTAVALMRNDIDTLKSASEGFAKALSQLTSVLTQVAVQDNRLLNMEKKLDELSHGKGFVR